MSIIKTVGRFQGDTLEKNEQRIEMIRFVKQYDSLLVIIKKFLDRAREHDINGLVYIIENELFFEVIPVYVIEKYLDRLNMFSNVEDSFEEAYRLKAETGFRRSMDWLFRQVH
ncbi:hypothetical protein M8668_13220 [Clostridioides difficile]|nr:hypothetical protein [Clostridioides difficile]